MENIKSGFIKPNKEIISLPYYALESWCKDEIRKYIREDKSKQLFRLERFKQFCKDYTYFKPYLDFVIFEMKYIQINPFFMKKFLGYADGEQYFVESSNRDCITKTGGFYFNRSSFQNYNIQKNGIIENGMIDVRGNTIELFSDGDDDLNAWGHPGLSSMVLNQFVSFSKMLYDDFIQYRTENHPNLYTMYLIERLGFVQVTKRRSHSFIHINPSLLTKEQAHTIYLIREYYGHHVLPVGERQNDIKPKQLIKEIWGDVYENR